MIMNEASQDALKNLKIRVQEQLGIKIDSCVFIALGTKSGQVLTQNTPVITTSIHDIPSYLDNANHDMAIISQALELARTREAMRKGFGFVKESPPDQ